MSQKKAYLPSLILQNPLPLRDPKSNTFKRNCGGQEIIFSSSRGIPYGRMGRLIFVFCVTFAVIKGTSRVELGHVMSWMKTMKLHTAGGNSIDLIRDQFERFSSLSINWRRLKTNFSYRGPSSRSFSVTKELELWVPKTKRDTDLDFTRECYLIYEEEYMKFLQEGRVPIVWDAYLGLRAEQSQDIYGWLAWKLPILKAPLTVKWKELIAQFSDHPPNNLSQWKIRWKQNALRVISQAYPLARLTYHDEGVTLHYAPPVVLPRKKVHSFSK